MDAGQEGVPESNSASENEEGSCGRGQGVSLGKIDGCGCQRGRVRRDNRAERISIRGEASYGGVFQEEVRGKKVDWCDREDRSI